MSTQVFPSLPLIGWPVIRTPVWKSRVQESVSGKRTRIADWSFPRWRWELTFEGLRQGSLAGAAYTELAQLAGFLNSRQGMFDSFLYEDGDDKAVTGQVIGTGDGSNTLFQLVRAFGGFVEPILAPNAVTAVKLNGTPTLAYGTYSWGSDRPGIVQFAAPPGGGVVVTADFTYYWPVAFADDMADFPKIMSNIYECRSLKFESIK